MINVFLFYGAFIQIALQWKTNGRNLGFDWGQVWTELWNVLRRS